MRVLTIEYGSVKVSTGILKLEKLSAGWCVKPQIKNKR